VLLLPTRVGFHFRLQKYVESIVEIGEPCAANDATDEVVGIVAEGPIRRDMNRNDYRFLVVVRQTISPFRLELDRLAVRFLPCLPDKAFPLSIIESKDIFYSRRTSNGESNI
jgi:hypothetical protein